MTRPTSGRRIRALVVIAVVAAAILLVLAVVGGALATLAIPAPSVAP